MRLTQQLLTALILLNIVNAYDSDDCITDFTNMATYTNVVEDPEDFLIDFTADVCIPMLSNAENGFKTFVCSYSTLFALEEIQLLAEEGGLDDGTADIYIADYCNNIQNATQEKIFVIDKLSQLDPWADEDTWNDNCIDQMLSYANYWFDPLIPSQAITYGDMCEAFHELFQQLDYKEIDSFEDSVIYSYVLVYQMYLNSQQEQSYAKCIDSHLEFQSQSYCETSLASNFNFTLWVEESPQKECAYAIDAYNTECPDLEDETDESTTDDSSDDSDSDSDDIDYDQSSSNQTELYTNTTADESQMDICQQPCAYVLSYMFSSYETYITSVLEAVFMTVQQQSAYALTEGIIASTDNVDDEVEDVYLNDDEYYTPDISTLTTTTTTPTS